MAPVSSSPDRLFSSAVRLALGCLVSLFFVLLAAHPAVAKSIVVLAPHPDDETLLGAGVLRRAVLDGDTVTVIVVANGDYKGTSTGYVRQAETVRAMELLGLSEDQVVFLGYGDASLLALYRASDTTILASVAGQTRTYGNRGLGRTDYHTYLHGAPADYTRKSLLGDMTAALVNFRPDEIYTTGYYDGHTDHQATYLILVEALLALRRQEVLAPRLYETLVHEPCTSCVGGEYWPLPVAPGLPYPAPPSLGSSPLRWDRIVSIPVPVKMRSEHPPDNLKYQAVSRYESQQEPWMYGFVKKNEFFWLTDFRANLAPDARVSVSSENRSTGQLGIRAVDGIVDGWPRDYTKEWATVTQLAGAWIRLTWPSPVILSQVALHGRPNGVDRILAGTLRFSDQTSVAVGALPTDGGELRVTFPARTVTFVEFRIDSAAGYNTGLAEIRVFGRRADSAELSVPVIYDGPRPEFPAIDDLQQAQVTVKALDLDGGDLQYAWSAEAGTVVGTTNVATFVPPRVTKETYVAVTVTVTAAGGTSSNSAFVLVRPTVDIAELSLAAAVLGAGQTTTATVRLAGAAPGQGVQVSLGSANTNIATVPATVTVAAGATTATFVVTAGAVSSPATVAITAAVGTGNKRAAVTVVPNLAPRARVSVSSENLWTGQLGVKAVDGIVNGYPRDYGKEWATVRQLAGAWILLTWSSPVQVSEIDLYDRPNGVDQVLAGRLLFSDGTTVAVGALPNDSSEFRVTFNPKTVTWVKFQIDKAVGSNIGLAEIRAFAK